jgi:hypothetical protein
MTPDIGSSDIKAGPPPGAAPRGARALARRAYAKVHGWLYPEPKAQSSFFPEEPGVYEVEVEIVAERAPYDWADEGDFDGT